MALRKLVRRNYGRKLPVSIKYENIHSFKEGVILLCQSILEKSRISHLHGSALFTTPLNSTPFQEVVKLLKLNRFLKKALRQILKATTLSLLPLLSKIIERIVHDQKEESLSKNKLLYRFQSGFRKNYSTNTCLGHLTDKITTGFKKGLFTGMILIDLQKVFDTIDHQILLKKMKYLGFSKNKITWFKSYLCEQKFKISINTSYSSPSNLLCGIPQGSILGPLLFLLYINDLPQAIVSNSLLYADDTCIVFQH